MTVDQGPREYRGIRPAVGVDVGVKGSFYFWTLDQPIAWAWDLAGVVSTRDVLTAILRGRTIAGMIVRACPANAVFILDEPVWIGGERIKKSGWQHGLQCVLFGALVGALGEARGDESVATFPGGTVRKIVGVTGRGKSGIIAWMESQRGMTPTDFAGWPKWKRETVAEASMLCAAGTIATGEGPLADGSEGGRSE